MVGGKAGGLWLKRQRMRMMASTRMVAPTDLWMAITWPASPRGSVSAYQASVNCTTTSRAISQCSSCAVRVYFSITGLFTCTPPLLLASGFVLRQQVRERSEEHTSELQSRENLVCRLLLEKKKPA